MLPIFTKQQKNDALVYLPFLKEKCYGTIKVSACANSQKQQEGPDKKYATSLSVSLEYLLLNATIDAYEGQDVDMVDIPGAFMYVDMDEEVIMNLQGRLLELMIITNPSIYTKRVTIERGKQVLYVYLQKVLYGSLRSALLFY